MICVFLFACGLAVDVLIEEDINAVFRVAVWWFVTVVALPCREHHDGRVAADVEAVAGLAHLVGLAVDDAELDPTVEALRDAAVERARGDAVRAPARYAVLVHLAVRAPTAR